MTPEIRPGVPDAAPGTVSADEVLAGLPDAVLVIDASAHVLWANPAAERLFGVELAEADGMSGLDLVHPDDVAMAALSMETVQGKERGTPIELRIRGAEGWRLVELVGAPCERGITLVLRDLTERRRWEVGSGREELFRTLVQHAPSITVLVDAGGTVRSCSVGLPRLLGLDPEWLEGRPLGDLVSERSRPVLDGAWEQLRGGRRTLTVDVVATAAQDRTVPLSVTLVDLLDDPTVEGVVATLHDITDRVAAEEAVRRTNSVLAATLEATAEGILVVDRHERMVSHNTRFAEMWRLGPDLLEQGDVREMFRAISPHLRDPAGFVSRVAGLSEEPEAESHDVVELSDGRVLERDSRPQRIDGRVVGRVWSFRDVTAHRVLQNELARQAFHDPLTGLANQALFRDRVRNSLDRARRRDGHVAVLFVDLDNFKMVNDGLGHAAGDQLLVTLADRLRNAVRGADTVARLGGDEFAVLVEDVDDERAHEIADRVLAVLREPVVLGAHQVTASASIGICFGSAEQTAGELLRNADLAMYEAKSAGRGCARVFTPDMHDAAVHRLEVNSRLRGAAARGELEVHYQPVLDTERGTVVSMEALVRWDHPDHGLLLPDHFMAVAEDSGLINEIGEHVLAVAVAEAARWPAGPDGLPDVAVNLSPRQLLDDAFPARMAAQLEGSGLEPGRLVLEITESALMADPEHAVTVLGRIRDVGVRLAVDDFGTGYSSMATLQRFPLDLLKLDRSFVADILDPQRSSLARAIVQMAHTLGLTPIAEGVEDCAQLAALQDMACELAQGFLFSRPLPAADARAYLAERAAAPA